MREYTVNEQLLALIFQALDKSEAKSEGDRRRHHKAMDAIEGLLANKQKEEAAEAKAAEAAEAKEEAK